MCVKLVLKVGHINPISPSRNEMNFTQEDETEVFYQISMWKVVGGDVGVKWKYILYGH